MIAIFYGLLMDKFLSSLFFIAKKRWVLLIIITSIQIIMVANFNNVINSHVTNDEIQAFFKVTSTINKLIAEKMIYQENTQDKKAV